MIHWTSRVGQKIRLRLPVLLGIRLHPKTSESATLATMKQQFIHFSCTQGCSGPGTSGNGVPTLFSRFGLKWLWRCFKMAIF